MWRTYGLCVVCFSVFVAVDLWRAPDNPPARIILSAMIALVLVIITSSLALKQNDKVWQSVQIEVGDDYIARSQVRIPQMRIERSEVTSIEEMESCLCIRTTNKRRTLAVPNVLDDAGYQEIKGVLSTWTTIQPAAPGATIRSVVFVMGVLLGFGILFFSSVPWLTLAAGGVNSLLLGYVNWTLRHTEGIDPKVKRGALVVFVFALIFTAMKVHVLLRFS